MIEFFSFSFHDDFFNSKSFAATEVNCYGSFKLSAKDRIHFVSLVKASILSLFIEF